MFMPGEIREDKTWRRGEFKRVVDPDQDIVLIQLAGDPFAVCVYTKQIRPTTEKENKMSPSATKEKPKAKDLRRKAKALGVDGWEDMSLDELIAAVDKAEAKDAKKSGKKSTKKAAAPVVDEDDDEDEDDEDEDDEDDDDDEDEDEAPAKSKRSSKKSAAAKKSTSKSKASKSKDKASSKSGKKSGKSSKKAAAKPEREVAENGNPYAEGTNLWHMAEALIEGGKVKTLVKKLRKKVQINARTRDYDEDSLNAELQRRLIIVSQHLRNDFGFEMEKEGRGWDAVIRCYKD